MTFEKVFLVGNYRKSSTEKLEPILTGMQKFAFLHKGEGSKRAARTEVLLLFKVIPYNDENDFHNVLKVRSLIFVK